MNFLIKSIIAQLENTVTRLSQAPKKLSRNNIDINKIKKILLLKDNL